MGSAVTVQGLSCFAAWGIFPDQGSNPGPLLWQADSSPLEPPGSRDPNLIPWADHLSICFPDGEKQEQSL